MPWPQSPRGELFSETLKHIGIWSPVANTTTLRVEQTACSMPGTRISSPPISSLRLLVAQTQPRQVLLDLAKGGTTPVHGHTPHR